uniref:Putative secreted protein n=1 Tax=Anopheles marajoara TaxID=58244 RepID=A0A2M4CF95_9DIPT
MFVAPAAAAAAAAALDSSADSTQAPLAAFVHEPSLLMRMMTLARDGAGGDGCDETVRWPPTPVPDWK